jgi:DNA modification methylase
MSLRERIKNYLELKTDNQADLNELYGAFPNEKQTTIRGRLNANVGKDFVRTGRGVYLLLGAEVECIIEKTDSISNLPNIIKSNIYYDLIFLDIPYNLGGQKGGNRDLSSYQLIEPEEFEKIAIEAQKMLRTEDSQIYFMIAGGKSSIQKANKYIRAFDKTSLIESGEGSYTKLNSNGSVCNMGKYKMPPEIIKVFSHSGKLQVNDEVVQLDFSLQRPPLPRSGGYPTQKPLDMLIQIIKQSTNAGDKVLDLFGGSGATLRASLLLKRFCHIFDIEDDAIRRMVAIAKDFITSKRTTNQNNCISTGYSAEQLSLFNQGRLF